MMKLNEQTKHKEELSVDVLEQDLYSLILYNDDVNTFDHVIQCLVSICKHNSVQAEQCAYLVHFNGKTDVKMGELDELQTYKQALIEEGLSAVVEKAN